MRVGVKFTGKKPRGEVTTSQAFGLSCFWVLPCYKAAVTVRWPSA